MKRQLALLVIVTLLQTAGICDEAAGGSVKVHLPREVCVKDKNVRLGDIAAVSGEGELARKVVSTAVGTMSKPGQATTFERRTIMARLGSEGVDMSQVTLTGAESVTVTLARTSVSAAELLAVAEKFALRSPIPADQRLHALDLPADVNLTPGAGKIEVVPSAASKPGDSPVAVKVAVVQGGKTVASREVRFMQVPRNARAAAKSTDAKPIAADAPKVVFRNQPVVIEVDSAYLKVTAMGLPLEDGKVGQLIKVRNLDSKRDIVARVMANGTVAPIL